MTAGGEQNGTVDGGDLRRPDRCPACGRRRLQAGSCHACGHRETVVANADGIELPGALPPPGGSAFPLDGCSQGRFGMPEGGTLAPSTVAHGLAPVGEAPDFASVPPPPSRDASTVSGRVLYLSPPAYEPMDFDPWRWVAIPAWGLVLLLVPVAGTLAAFQWSGPFAALIVAAVLLLVLRFVFSNRLIDSWHLVAALNGRHLVEPMPVQVVRLRRWDGREAQLRFKGFFANGAVMEGDRLEATGRWRNGVLLVREARCERTGARIDPRLPNAKGFALVGLACLAGMTLWVLAAGLPLFARLGGGAGPGLPSIEFPMPSPDPLQP